MCEISIIVPIYNSEKYLEKCIESVLKQEYECYELILIDDGSTDQSGIICDQYAKKDNRIKVIHKNNSGVSDSRNIGIKRATGKYILFLDSDDWIEGNSLDKIYEAINEKELDILIFGYREIYENKNTSKINSYFNSNDDRFEDVILNISSNIKGFLFNKLIRKSCIEYYFNESIYVKEDLYFLLQNRENFKRFDIIPDIIYNYRIRDTSVSHVNIKNVKHISELEVDKYIVEKVQSKYSYDYKLLFIEEYFCLLFYLGKEDKKYLKKIYENIQQQYYNEVMKFKNINRKIKIKLFIKKEFQILYRFLRRIKGK